MRLKGDNMPIVVHGGLRNTSRPVAWLKQREKGGLLRKARSLGITIPKNVTKARLVELLRTD